MAETKKQNFLHGTALLAMSVAMVKIIGAFYSIPLKRIIGDDGFGFYSTAYEIYTLLLMISTAGLPVAMSRIISQASSLGNYKQVRKIYSVSRAIFLGLGLAGTALMVFFCKPLARLLNHNDAWAAIAALGPACLLICLMSTYRGFFQGQSNMMPTSISQVLEAFCKLIAGLSLALLVLHFTNDYALAAAGAILGVTLSCLVGSVYLKFTFHKAYRELPNTGKQTESRGTIAKNLLAIAIPITIGAAGLQLLTVLETGVYMGRLQDMMSENQANIQKGIYNFTQKIFNMPCAFITPVTISIIPAITAQLTTGNRQAARATAESSARVTALITMPCAVGLAVLAEPVTALLGGYSGERLELASSLMCVLGICIVFNATVLLTNAIMQANGHAVLPVVNMFVGGFIKLAAVLILTGNPHIGILGTPLGSLLSYFIITVLNLITMKVVLKDPPAIVKNMLRGLLSAAVMGGVTFGCWYGLKMLGISSNIILCGGPIAVGALVYLVCAVKLRAFTREDCVLLPKGEKIADILKL
ncbi:MAG: polysaccharide biosynthesis protein [Ruminococcaceae bacterium]|nr:polysaccharide biosynthesis protein [Oscillospiraceae bacterium]MBQ3215182.1 polysaccharide biosynthesis protein [Oscillospiraceae bacterium]